MITNTLKECCYTCNHSDVDTDVNAYSCVCPGKKDLFKEYIQCTIYCRHAKVCKVYIESEERLVRSVLNASVTPNGVDELRSLPL